ncbi:MAG: M28 family peptidase [Flavobacteriales bacterium]|nr:M28 family peptidase [Flavobacteriales bacterium]
MKVCSLFPIIALYLWTGCGTADERTNRDAWPDEGLPELPPTPLVDPDSAYHYVERQVSFGPRVPGSDAHRNCGDWLVARLTEHGAVVHEQVGKVTAFNGQQLPLRNIIGSWSPDRSERILLLAHWDTRPFADKDEERKNEPIDGANDGGSGVGVLLEIARHLGAKEHGPGVDILFTDVEDFGSPSGAMGMGEGSMDTWALGSQYWARSPHKPGYTARFGILLDMVGGRDARFYQEALSMQYAPAIVRKVWRTADALGYGDRFIQEQKYFVGTDDHVPVNEYLRIPTIDIIEFHESTGGFHPSWHTHDDNMSVIDRSSLKAVGQTVMEVVWKERD